VDADEGEGSEVDDYRNRVQGVWLYGEVEVGVDPSTGIQSVSIGFQVDQPSTTVAPRRVVTITGLSFCAYLDPVVFEEW